MQATFEYDDVERDGGFSEESMICIMTVTTGRRMESSLYDLVRSNIDVTKTSQSNTYK